MPVSSDLTHMSRLSAGIAETPCQEIFCLPVGQLEFVQMVAEALPAAREGVTNGQELLKPLLASHSVLSQWPNPELVVGVGET